MIDIKIPEHHILEYMRLNEESTPGAFYVLSVFIDPKISEIPVQIKIPFIKN